MTQSLRRGQGGKDGSIEKSLVPSWLLTQLLKFSISPGHVANMPFGNKDCVAQEAAEEE